MAGLCTAAMVSSMVVPVWAADDAAEEETADDGDVADISEALIGIWQDSAGDIYGFYKDNSCLLYTYPSPRDATLSRMPSSA